MFLSNKTQRAVYLFGIAVSLCALPVSVFALSVGQIVLIVAWLLSAQWSEKFHRFISSKSLMIFLLAYTSMVVGFFYSNNIGYAIKELKLWLPLLILPVVIGTSDPLTKRELKYLLLLFCASVFVASLISVTIYIIDYQRIGQNVREISPFISHIRLALMVNFSIFILLYFSFTRSYFSNKAIKGVFVVIAVWLIAFLLMLQSITGFLVLAFVSIFFLVRWALKQRNTFYKIGLFVGLLVIVSLSLFYLVHTVDHFFTRNRIDFKNLPQYTINGNPYLQDTLNNEYENGNLVWINVCIPELKKSWEKVSKIPFQGMSRDSQIIEFSLVRYMTSKGLPKDSAGFSKLDSEDIRLVENSVTSVIFREHKGGIYPRLYQLLWEIDSYIHQGKVGGSSVVQRYIYLQASWAIIRNNVLFGVGTGDGKDSMMNYYRTSKVNLEEKYWLLSHNQFLTVWIASGIIGLLLFLTGLLYPFFRERKYLYFFCLVFQIIIFVSMLGEDTFETHVGISFAAMFYSLFYFGYDFGKEVDECKGNV